MRSSDWSSDVCSSDLVVGQQARRNLKANDVLHPGMVEAARLVKRGDLVVVSAEDGRVAVRSQGIALQEGAEGASGQVRNSRPGRAEARRVGKGCVSNGRFRWAQNP